MKKNSISTFIWGILGVLFVSCNSQTGGVQQFDMQKIAAHYSNAETKVKASDIFGKDILYISPADGNEGVVIWEKGDKPAWDKGNYLVFEVYGEAEYSGVINIEFYKDMKNFVAEKIVLQGGETSGTEKDMSWISCLMGTLPQLKTQVVFPLSYLDAQQLFVPRSPRQLKGTVSGNRLAPEDIVKVVLRFGPYDGTNYLPSYELASIFITDSLPEPYPDISTPVIDRLGQWKDKEWPGKLKDEKDMVLQNQEMAKKIENARFPSEWGRFGGWKKKPFKSTGFFRTQHDGTRWWLVDPDGYAFLSVGIDCIGPNSSGPVNGIEDLFDWLPGDNDSEYAEAVKERRGFKTVDFYVANMIRIYGQDWRNQWDKVTENLMKKIRFNTVGNWSDIDFARKSRIPYVLPLRDFPSTEVSIYRDFPDVFSDEYLQNAKEFAQQLKAYKDDPYMVGYFLRNEPQWAFGYHNLAYEMFATQQVSHTKDGFINWLENKYQGNVKEVNAKWNLDLKDFASLKDCTFKEYPSEVAKDDFHEFSTIMVKMYVDIPCDEVIKIDKNHLNLGMRYAWLSSDLLYKAGERFDVFSINGYGLVPPPTAEIAERSGKPVMIGEFHQGAVDRALPATGIIGVLNQQERAAAYRNYIEQGFARPELVGMHYFQWIDQPYYGRFDGENYNIGVVTACNIPYPELTEAMTITNERIYDVATGKVEPYSADIPKTPAIHY